MSANFFKIFHESYKPCRDKTENARWELAHRRAFSGLDLYGDSRDRANWFARCMAEQFPDFTGFLSIYNFLICFKNDLLHHFYTISAKTTSHARGISGCPMGVYSHEGRLEIALMRRQPRPSEPAREVHGEVPFWELAHIKARSVLDL